MKSFYCECGHHLFFDSTECVSCGRPVAFDPQSLDMQVLEPAADNGRGLCANGSEYHVCNWLQTNSERIFCLACDLNRTIPNLAEPINQTRWAGLEAGKKRLIYSLLRLQLPIVSRHVDETGLCFDFLEDGRTNAQKFGDVFHHTGYADGVITINVLEADPAAREATREAMNEQYRTVLGHMRHESGHYFYEKLFDQIDHEKLKRLFGDFSRDYATDLQRYYDNGPPEDWSREFISAYSSAHPLEDWAESWAHYLHLTDALETAAAHGILTNVEQLDFTEKLGQWRKLSIVLNELNRGFGVSDAYPFVISERAGEKLVFVHDLIRSINS